MFLCVDCWSQSYRVFPGTGTDQRTLRMQERVEEIYMAGEYARAQLLYAKELAPLGDKYAQYMVGFMYQNGEGVPQDTVEALAWYRLAAERGEPLLANVRDSLFKQMSARDILESEARFVQLWKSIGDHKLILDLIQRDLKTLRAQTGTRIPGSSVSSPGRIFKPSGEQISPTFYLDVRRQLSARIGYLESNVEIVDDVVADELARIRSLGAEVKAELAALKYR